VDGTSGRPHRQQHAYKRLLTKCADHITGRECCKRARATTGQTGQTGPAAKETKLHSSGIQYGYTQCDQKDDP
jgi:hypothetical protein